MRIAVLDPSLATDNLGDEVIWEAVSDELFSLFPRAFFERIATHEPMSARAHRVLRAADHVFIAGSNLLPPHPEQWPLTLRDTLRGRANAVVFGAGWQHDNTRMTARVRLLLRRFLSSTALHAVRDERARHNLDGLGLRVADATCPTLWRMTPERCAAIPVARAPDVVVTVTAYRNQAAADGALLKLLTERYRKVWVYPQMASDDPHVDALGFAHLPRIRASTAAFTAFLREQDVDYVGSRLHGGIRALQAGKRSLVLQVDNRARDIAAQTGLPSLPLADPAGISAWIETPAPTAIRLPDAQIAAFRAQFAGS